MSKGLELPCPAVPFDDVVPSQPCVFSRSVVVACEYDAALSDRRQRRHDVRGDVVGPQPVDDDQRLVIGRC